LLQIKTALQASPIHVTTHDPSDVIDPAVKGTTGILESIKAHGQSVKRVVLTSSIAAIQEYPIDSPRTFDETMWNDQAIRLVQEKAGEADGLSVYGASKTLAEKGACFHGVCDLVAGLTLFYSCVGLC
jgi:nucleoside-diphosphate-sugar epimerase